MLEREIEKKVCDYAKSVGFEVYKFSSPNRVGVPDRLFVAPHQRAFWIEFKREGGKPTPVQMRECRKLRDCGFDVYLVDSVEDGKAVVDEQLEIAKASLLAYEIGSVLSQAAEQDQDDQQTRH
jgi:hypothetical protein